MNKSDKIYIAGHRGMVGSAIWRKLEEKGYTNLIGRTSSQLDLKDQRAVTQFFNEEKPEYVFLAAAKVGGIQSNNIYRADFLYENLMIQNNVIHQAHIHQVKKLIFLGSSCIYPKFAEQPIKEEYLLTGKLEDTNEPYAVAKIAGIKLCESYKRQYGNNFISLMPTNLYGYGDNYDLQNSHVLPALIRKIYEAKLKGEPEVVIWGTGKPLREFLFADDLADACIFLMKNYNEDKLINVGYGEDISILELAKKIKSIAGYKGKLINDMSKPDGTPRKLMDSSRLFNLGWKPKVSLDEGLHKTYQDFQKNYITYTT